MKPTANFRPSYGRRIAGPALTVALIALSAPVHAHVIEIGDDGDTRIFDGPGPFASGEIQRESADIETKRAGTSDRYERAAQAEGVDVRVLRAIAWHESRGRMDVVSSKGALGIMQLMPATAAALGVDPLDPDANVAGGARFFARMMSRFQSVPLALAAYSAGPGAVLRWGGIPPYAETRSYVSSIMSRLRDGSAAQPPNAISPARIDSMLIEVP